LPTIQKNCEDFVSEYDAQNMSLRVTLTFYFLFVSKKKPDVIAFGSKHVTN